MDRVLPDAEGLLVAYLRTHELLAGVTVATLRAADLGPLPLVVLRRVGGTPRELWRTAPVLDRPAIAVQAWAISQAQAAQLALRTLAALYASRGTHPTGTVVRVTTLAGVAETPDPAAPEGTHRYTFTVSITTR